LRIYISFSFAFLFELASSFFARVISFHQWLIQKKRWGNSPTETSKKGRLELKTQHGHQQKGKNRERENNYI
jgi:hypothetical protein